MIYKLTSPVIVGDLDRQITINELRVAAISLNFQSAFASKGTAVLSVLLEHPATGHTMAVTYYAQADAMGFWNTLNASDKIVAAVLQKLMADGKLPPGTITT